MFVPLLGAISATQTEYEHSLTRFSDPEVDSPIGLRSYKNRLRRPGSGHCWLRL